MVQADGKVYRCGQLAREELCIGDLFNDEFELFETGKPCTVDFCRSKEFQSAWEDEDRHLLEQQGKVRA